MRTVTAPACALPTLMLTLLASASWAMPVRAQENVVPTENVRTDYAQVLRVEPVYQVLRANRQEQQCSGQPVPAKNSPKGLSRIVDVVKDVLGKADADPPATSRNCQTVTVEREFRRPIAYDVDYIYRGMKYRSRLPNDPGNRLRVRVSVAPYVPADGAR